MPPLLTPWAIVNQTGMVSTGERSVFRPFQNLRCCHESPRPSGMYLKFWKGLKADPYPA